MRAATATATAERPAVSPVPDREIEFQVTRGAAGMIAVLEAFREGSGASKAELARRLDVHREEISRLLSEDDTNPTLKSVARLLAALGLHMELVIREARPRDQYLIEVVAERDGARRTAGKDL